MSSYEILSALADVVPIDKSDALELLPLMTGCSTDEVESELRKYGEHITEVRDNTIRVRERIELRNKKRYGVKGNDAKDMSRTVTYSFTPTPVSSAPPFHLAPPTSTPVSSYSLLSKPKHFYSDECNAIYDALSEIYGKESFSRDEGVEILGIMLNMKPDRAASQLTYMLGKGYLRGEE